MDQIFIQGLRFDCIIGIYPEERVTPQPLVIDLEMDTDIRESALTGDLNHSLNYAEISDAIMEFCTQRKAELIESLAEELATLLLQRYPLIQQLRLCIGKPQAVSAADSVGVRIQRSRS